MNPPKMPVHIGDLLRDTGHLRGLRFGGYMLLLFHHWSTGELPDDDEQLSAIARMTPPEWKAARPILEKFFGPGWVHDRVLTDLADAKVSYEKLATASAAGVKAKAEKKRRSTIGATDGSTIGKADGSTEPIPWANLPLTVNQSDIIAEARPRGKSLFTEGSKALTDAFWRALAFEKGFVPPEFAGVDWRAVEWEIAGWTADLIETEARRTGPDKPLSYHEKVFATAFAKRQAPLPIVEIREAEKLTVTHGTAKNQSGVVAAARRLAEQFENQSGDGIEGNPNAVLRVSQG